jgi:hypothetical protein
MSSSVEGPEGQINVGDLNLNCNQNDTFVIVSSVLFVLYLSLKAKKNINNLLCNGGSHIIISYYALLWIVTLLNLALSLLQVHNITIPLHSSFYILLI